MHFPLILNRILPKLQLKRHNPQSPNVYFLPKPPLDNLRSHILNRPHKGRYPVLPTLFVQQLRKRIIRQLYMPLVRYQYVLRLQLPVHYALVVDVPHPYYYLSQHIFYCLLGQLYPLLVRVKIQVSLREVLHYYVNVVVELEGLVNVDQECIVSDLRQTR